MSSKTSITRSFKVDANLILEMGERLVGDDAVALNELIKNAYDADATRVVVSFKGVRETGGTIEVVDNGHGMTLDDIENGWMLISSILKKRRTKSRIYGRTYTGSKGIGRFACQRLATGLRLRTRFKSDGILKQISGFFDWSQLVPGTLVEDFEIELTIEDVIDSTETGTTLALVGVKRKWTKEMVEKTRDSVSSLARPVPWAETTIKQEGASESDQGMEILIEAEELRVKGPVTPSFLKASWGVLEGEISEAGSVAYQIRSRHLERKRSLKSNLEPKHLGPASFQVYFYVYEKSSLGDFPKNTAQELGREFGGVRIFYDAFRIPSYGEPGNDWLDLDTKRAGRVGSIPDELKGLAKKSHRPMLLLPGNNQLVGSVRLSRNKNPQLEVAITRERIEANEAFDELKQFVFRGIEFLTVVYASTKAPKRRTARPVTRALRKTVQRVEEMKKAVAEADDISPETSSALDSHLRKFESDLEKTEDLLEKELMTYRVLATTGMLTGVFTHELRDLLRMVREFASDFESNNLSESEKSLEELKGWLESVEEQAYLIGMMLGKQSRSSRRPVLVWSLVNTVFGMYRRFTEALSIEPQNGCGLGQRTPPMYPGEVYSIIINLFANSMKSVQKKAERVIRIETEDRSDEFVIRVLDTGVGVQPALREKVFEPFYSTTEPSIDFGTGTGLGLTLVRNIAEDYDGTAHFINPPRKWNACIEIKIPREVMIE